MYMPVFWLSELRTIKTSTTRHKMNELMGYWETRLSRDEAGRRAVTGCMYMCTDRATVIVVSPCHCMIDLVSGYVRGLACDKTSQSTVGQLAGHTSW